MVFRCVPIIGVNMALPMIEAAGHELYDEVMMPMCLRLTELPDRLSLIPNL